MARYDITSGPLVEAGDALRLIADGLDEAREQLCGILSDLPKPLGALRSQITAECEAVEGLRLSAMKFEQVLIEVLDVYARAERSTLGGSGQTQRQPDRRLTHPPPIAHRMYGVLFSSCLILPDWFQAAVIKYEQSAAEQAGAQNS
ncbi:MAG: hypothetical protein FWH57_02350 [Oscillospiraceae bacterium]|nr:hypothetical protein [Oscillospiraceae bacterium]